jgi:hypothetical protein
MLHPLTDGIVTIRAPRDGDAEVLVTGRDEEFRRYLGSGDPDPRPFACVEVEGKVVGWVDYDADRTRLEPGEVNVGYNMFARTAGAAAPPARCSCSSVTSPRSRTSRRPRY